MMIRRADSRKGNMDMTERFEDKVALITGGASGIGRAVALLFSKQRGGVIVNTTSAAARKVVPGVSAYSAAKAGVAQLSRVAALEYGKAGIRINAVVPGYTRTPGILRPLSASADGLKSAEQIISDTPMG